MNKQLLQNLMHISRLNLSEEEQEAMLHDLEEMAFWIQKLREVDTKGVEPLAILVEDNPNMREDIPTTPLNHTKALSSASKKDSNYFRVPKVKN